MDKLVSNQGLWHLAETIFEYLSYQDLKNCCQVSPEWNLLLTREHGLLENVEADLNFLKTTDFYALEIDETGCLIDETIKKGTIFGLYCRFEAFIDQLKTKTSLKLFQAFLSKFKILVLKWKDLSFNDGLMPTIYNYEEMVPKPMDTTMTYLKLLSTKIGDRHVIDNLLSQFRRDCSWSWWEWDESSVSKTSLTTPAAPRRGFRRWLASLKEFLFCSQKLK